MCGRVGIPAFRHHDPTADAQACAELVHAIGRQVEATSLEEAAQRLGVTLGSMDPEGYASCLAARARGSHWADAPIDPSSIDPDHPFAGVGVALTGTLLSMTRNEAKLLIRQAGGEFKSSMSKLCSYLVMGDQDFGRFVDGEQSEKSRRAADLIREGYPVQIIGEDDFLKMAGV